MFPRTLFPFQSLSCQQADCCLQSDILQLHQLINCLLQQKRKLRNERRRRLVDAINRFNEKVRFGGDDFVSSSTKGMDFALRPQKIKYVEGS